MSVFIGNKEFLDCTECSRCKPRDGLKHGVRYVAWAEISYTLNRGKNGEHADQAGFIIMYLVVVFMRRNDAN